MPACSSKTRMNSSPISRRFSSGSSTPLEPREEPVLCLHVDERHLEVAAERLHDLLGLVGAHEAVVDEDAGELVTDCLVHEQRGNGRVDAAGERTEHAVRPHLGADSLHLLLDHGGGRPGGRRVGDPEEEVLEDVLPVRGVPHLGVELDAVEPPLAVLECRNRRRGRAGDHLRARRRRGDGVAMAHPDGLLGRQPCEERPTPGRQRGLAELRDAGAVDGAAELERHQLHAVADPEGGNAELEQARVDPRCVVRVHRCGAAGQDQRERVAGAHLVRAEPVRDELGVDAGLTDAPRDQLRVLPAEVEHEHRPLLRRRGAR